MADPIITLSDRVSIGRNYCDTCGKTDYFLRFGAVAGVGLGCTERGEARSMASGILHQHIIDLTKEIRKIEGAISRVNTQIFKRE